MNRDSSDREFLSREADTHTANAVAKVRRDREARDRQYRQWDSLITGDEFAVFLTSKALIIQEAYPALPYDSQAEMCVIGAICMDGAAASTAIGPLHPAHFRFPETGNALRAIASLRQQQRQGKAAPIDITTIASTMRRQGTFSEGERGVWSTGEFLTECAHICPCAQNVGAYIEAVLCASRLRYQHWLALAYARECLKAEAEPEQLLSAMRGALDLIEGRGFVDLNTIFETPK